MQNQTQINRTIEALEGLKYDSLYDNHHEAIDIHLAVLENKLTSKEIEGMWPDKKHFGIAFDAWSWLIGEPDEDLDESQLIKDWRKQVEGIQW